MEITPTEYDVIVIGTGITECIVAAACSRIGKTVLHLDVNRFYGEQWSSFTLSGLEKTKGADYTPQTSHLQYNHFLQDLSLQNVLQERQCELEKDLEPDSEERARMADRLVKFERHKRRVNIDVTPKLCYSDGPMVDLLRSSNCSRYLEFKAVNRSLVHHEGELIQAPCNREQVFNSKHLKVLEKRLMMKFVSFALQTEEESEEWKQWEEQEESQLYKEFKLTDNLVKLVRASLVVTDKEIIPAHEALRSIKTYLKNVGIYGSMPYICPIYGAGELPQAFARFSAVFGSIYVLDMGVNELNFDEGGSFEGVTVQTGQKLSGKYCVVSPNYSASELQPQERGLLKVSHAVVLTERSVKEKLKLEEKDDMSLINILPGCLQNKRRVWGCEYGPGSMLPAEDMYMLHVMTAVDQDTSSSPEGDLGHVVDHLTNSKGTLYKIFFSTTMTDESVTRTPDLDKNVIQTSHPAYNSSYRECIAEARQVFSTLYPGEEFLPAAPNPEDIKWPDDEETEENTNGKTEENTNGKTEENTNGKREEVETEGGTDAAPAPAAVESN